MTRPKIDWSDRDFLYMLVSVRREVRTAPIVEPGLGEFSGRCMWSRTGWALHKSVEHCTCQPTNPPTNAPNVPVFPLALIQAR